MKFNNLFFVLWASVVIGTAGCGKDEEKREEKWEIPEQPTPPEEGTNLEPEVPGASNDSGTRGGEEDEGGDQASLTGKWVSGCINGNQDPHGYYFEFRPQSGQWLHARLLYEDSNCQSQYAARIFSGAMELKEPNEDQSDVYPLDLEVSSIKIVLLKEQDVEAFNQDKVFGYDDWVAGEAKETIGRKDSKGQEVKGFTNYNVVKVVKDQLYMSNFAELPEDRSYKLNNEPFYRM